MPAGVNELDHLWTVLSGAYSGLRVHVFANRERADPARPAVVLVHGLVIAGRYMLPTARELAPLCPVFVPDLPGYGWSDKPRSILQLPQLADALSSFLAAAGIRRAHLVANSFGCQVLVELAVRHPDAVDRLVLQGPTVDPAARTLWQQVRRLARNSMRESPGLGWITLADYWRAGVRRAAATVRMALADRIEEKLPKISAPTLVVRGERDPLVSQRWAEEVTRLLPKGELKVLPAAAHTINFTKPAEFVRTIRPFLEV